MQNLKNDPIFGKLWPDSRSGSKKDVP